MNNLSWFIYLTQATDSIRDGIILLWWMTVLIFIVWACAGAFTSGIEEKETKIMTTWKAAFRKAMIPMVIAVFVVAVIPSRQTMLLIAGSEMGERIVKSDAVKDIVNPGADLLKAWIKDETDKITNKKK